MSNPKQPAALCVAPNVTFVSAREPKEPQATDAPPMDAPRTPRKIKRVESDPRVQFSIQIRRSTYLALKQAEYWTPGFGEIRDHAEVAVKHHFEAMPSSKKTLPYKEISKNKKLQF